MSTGTTGGATLKTKYVDGKPVLVVPAAMVKAAEQKKLAAAAKVKPAFENAKAAELGKLVAEIIAAEPFEFEGHEWAAKHQNEWAALLGSGFSVSTIRELISKPPFVRERTRAADGKQITLLRIGTPGPKSPRHLANIMAKLFKKKFGKRPSDTAFGCLCGLAELWPAGAQIEIFKAVLSDWQGFMGVAKSALETAEDQGVLTFTNKKFNWLPITMLRIDCVAKAAVEFYVMAMQHKGQPIPASVKATMPETWPNVTE